MSRETRVNKLEKGRAEFAYRKVEEAIKRLGGKKKEYKSCVRKLPSMILNNGLGQTLAFVNSKGEKKEKKEKKENAYDIIYEQLTDYLKSDCTSRVRIPQDKDLLQWVISCDSSQYRYITNEVLAFLNWLKRFAEGMIEEGAEGEGTGAGL